MTPLADPVVWFGLVVAALVVVPAVVQAVVWEADDWAACHPARTAEPVDQGDAFADWAADVEWEDHQ